MMISGVDGFIYGSPADGIVVRINMFAHAVLEGDFICRTAAAGGGPGSLKACYPRAGPELLSL
jgi:hypothetical protein